MPLAHFEQVPRDFGKGKKSIVGVEMDRVEELCSSSRAEQAKRAEEEEFFALQTFAIHF